MRIEAKEQTISQLFFRFSGFVFYAFQVFIPGGGRKSGSNHILNEVLGVDILNYILEIKAFQDEVQLKQLSTGQIALWYALMYINNKCNWIEWFTVANRMLESNSGLSRQGILVARNVLKQYGYIDFKSNGTKATSYKLNSISKFVQATVQDTIQVPVQDTIQSSSTLNKRNKIKQNKTENTTPLPPLQGEQPPQQKNRANFFSEKSIKAELNQAWSDAKSEFSSNLQKEIQDWIRYKKEIKKEYRTLTGFTRFLTQVRKYVQEFGEKAVIEIMDSSMANGYQGITWDKLQKTDRERMKNERNQWDVTELNRKNPVNKGRTDPLAGFKRG